MTTCACFSALRAGTPFCLVHDLPLQAQSVSEEDTVLALPEDTRWLMILAPVARAQGRVCRPVRANAGAGLCVSGSMAQPTNSTYVRSRKLKNIRLTW
jgi:excinuclease UvrABC ATPase subunit